MQFLASYDGRRGEIVIMEDRDTGACSYYENGVFQSHATTDGISRFAYVQLMARLLEPAGDVLLLGCAAGSLATMLHKAGKRVTLVDDNPLSFTIARDYFGLPPGVTCVLADFRDFLARSTAQFDGIGIDIGAANMNFEHDFNAMTCLLLRDRLTPGGRVAMNVVALDDEDPMPDRVLARLTGSDQQGWIYDEPGKYDRNCILVAAPEQTPCPDACQHPVVEDDDRIDWILRRPHHDRQGARLPIFAPETGAQSAIRPLDDHKLDGPSVLQVTHFMNRRS